jgi:hypothetical protein
VIVKKFVLLAHGEMDQTPEFRDAHMAWWSSIRDHVIDPGSPLVGGHERAKDGSVSPIGPDDAPALGYSIVEAESIDDAIALLDGCPMDMWVYEAMAM